MIRKIIVLNIIISSFIFSSPSYSMLCCCGDESSERISLTHTTIQRNSPEEERKRQETQRRQEEEERKNLHEKSLQYRAIQTIAAQQAQFYEEKANKLGTHLSQDALKEEKNTERQVMVLGNFKVEVPTNLMLVDDSEGVKTLSLRDFVYIFLYDNYDNALSNNSDFKEVHRVGQELKKKSAVLRGMDIFYKDMRTKAEKAKENSEEIEQLIRIFQDIVTQIPEDISPVPVKFGQDMSTKRSLILIRMDKNKGALFVKGPANI